MSAEPGIPRRMRDLDEPDVTSERMLRLVGAQVVFADHALLRRDFPALRGASARAIDEWLVRHAAIVSAPQAAQSEVNEPIRTAGRSVTAYRPPRYGRAAIVPVEGGLLDVKGVGVPAGTRPVPTYHGDGLIALDVLLHELLNQYLVDAVFRHARTRLTTLPVYAVLDAGFGLRERWTGHGLAQAAGILVRRAHLRNRGNVELPLRDTLGQFVFATIEMLLRAYGITSVNPSSTIELRAEEDGRVRAKIREDDVTELSQEQLRALWRLGGEGRWTRFEGINIQTTRGVSVDPLRAELLDFGHFAVRARFEHPILSLVRDRPLRWGGVLTPDDASYVQPDRRHRTAMELWGRRRISAEGARLLGLPRDFQVGPPRLLAMVLAARWQRRERSGRTVLAALRAHVRATTSRWRNGRDRPRTERR